LCCRLFRRLPWLERHPRWTFHFTPTSCSWLNAVETFFAKLTRQRLRRGSFPLLVTTLREKLVKIGARIVRHGRYVAFQLAEVAVPRALFAAILRRIDRLRGPPMVAA
jgi:hypothetical protein